jgi:Tol biopolymer transport system component
MKLSFTLFAALVLLAILFTSNAAAQPPSPSSNLGALAYIQGGNVWVKELPAGEPRRLTTDGHNANPRWSPSGEWLAFSKDNQSWVIRKSGADAKAMPGCTGNWLPSEDALWCYHEDNRLVMRNVDGSAERAFIPSGASGEMTTGHDPAWSPDGKWIAYSLEKNDGQQPPRLLYSGIWVMRADGSDAHEVYRTDSSSDEALAVFGWSADGKNILFTRSVYLAISANLDGWPLEAVSTSGGEPCPLTELFLQSSDFVTTSPNQRLLAVVEGFDRQTWTNKRITVVDLLTLKKKQLTDSLTAALYPAWSPDSTRIAYAAAPDIGSVGGGDAAKAGMAKRRIWVMNRDGSNQRQLTNDPAYRDERPLWTVDGRYLVFARLDNATDKISIWLMPSDGGEPRRVVDELDPLDRQTTWFGYYGHISWGYYFDLWTRASPKALPDTGGASSEFLPLLFVGSLALLLGMLVSIESKRREQRRG